MIVSPFTFLSLYDHIISLVRYGYGNDIGLASASTGFGVIVTAEIAGATVSRYRFLVIVVVTPDALVDF